MNTPNVDQADPREVFRQWLDDFGAAADEDALLAEMANCWDMLPPRYCDELGLPPGSKYRDAVQMICSCWTVDAYSYPN